MTENRFSRKRAWWVFVSGWVLTLTAVIAADRAISTWSYSHHLRSYSFFDALTHLVDPLYPGAAIGLALAGLLAALGGWRPGAKAFVAIEVCLSLVVAVAIKEWLKNACGRTWPETWVNNNPSWIANHVFGFFPYHGGEGWHSFPSGHTTMMAAFMGVLWWRLPRLRWLWCIPVALVIVGLLGADYHWAGDIVAGAFIGGSVSYGVVALTDYLRGGAKAS